MPVGFANSGAIFHHEDDSIAKIVQEAISWWQQISFVHQTSAFVSSPQAMQSALFFAVISDILCAVPNYVKLVVSESLVDYSTSGLFCVRDSCAVRCYDVHAVRACLLTGYCWLAALFASQPQICYNACITMYLSIISTSFVSKSRLLGIVSGFCVVMCISNIFCKLVCNPQKKRPKVPLFVLICARIEMHSTKRLGNEWGRRVKVYQAYTRPLQWDVNNILS